MDGSEDQSWLNAVQQFAGPGTMVVANTAVVEKTVNIDGVPTTIKETIPELCICTTIPGIPQKDENGVFSVSETMTLGNIDKEVTIYSDTQA